MSVGNAVGSCIVNIALILGLSAVIRPVASEASINKRDLPVLIGITLAFCLFTLDFNLSRFEGIGLLLVFVIYIGFLVRNAKNNRVIADNEETTASEKSLLTSSLWALLGLGLLIGGAQLLVYSGTLLALKMGVSRVVISITMIALGTSLPELFTSVIAAVKGHSDISIGNIVGSNIFNISFVLGSSSLIGDMALPKRVAYFDNAIMLFLSLLLIPFLISGKKLIRAEGSILLLIYILYTANMFLKII
jgi:cation:H+ antiporter